MYIYNVGKPNGKSERIGVENAQELSSILGTMKALGQFSFIRGPFKSIEQADRALKAEQGIVL